jgi:SpoIID/LytB domain protein
MDSVRVGVLRNGSYEVTTIPLETYVARVLAGEAAPETPAAALEALAIAIRTYTITNRGRHAADGFDLCDQTHCQVMRTATPATERAALATADQILLYRGTPATVFYSASCGGRSEKPSNVWPGADDPPYLPIHDDDACGGFPAWSAELADVDLQRALAAGGYKGMLRDVRILSRNDSGRVARLALDGMTPREITGQDLRMVVGRTLGFQHIQSTQFDLRRTGRAYRFTGRGAGHGVGLCVIGSMKLASAGQSATTILARYFPGTQLGSYRARVTSAPSQTLNAPPAVPPRPNAPSSSQLSAATGPAAAGDARAALRPEIPTTTANPSAAGAPLPTDVAVTLPQDDTAERGVLALLVARERQALATALGVDPPAVRVHVYESNEAYERGSGRPWFTLGAFVNDEIQLVPLWLLRERGMLDRTLRRELVHVMVDRVLPARPAWIRDGAAIYFADPESVVNVRPPCPQDNELQRPVSPGELGDALARARACFERQVGNGRDWRRVR